MKQKFRDIRLSKANKERLKLVNSIVEDYQEQGYRLTLRQLYYQLVSRDIIPNQPSEYTKLSGLLKEGRMSGMVDWDAIEDRLRKPSKPSSWDSPRSILSSCVYSFALPRMRNQPTYIETWVEKDALSGVLSRVTEPFHVPIMVNRGYSSVSAMHDAYLRFKNAIGGSQKVVILYLGDFDPSGMDMIRDIRDRILEFLLNCEDLISIAEERIGFGLAEADMTTEQMALATSIYEQFGHNKEVLSIAGYKYEYEDYLTLDLRKGYIYSLFHVEPIALTREQINEYTPPPNIAKKTDTRSGKFIEKEGSMSWEVDALKPEVLSQILTSNIKKYLDLDIYEEVKSEEQAHKDKLTEIMNTL